MSPKPSNDMSFSWAVVTFEEAPHQGRICSRRMKVVTLPLRLITEQEVTDKCQNTAGGGGDDAVLQVPGDTYQQPSGQNE